MTVIEINQTYGEGTIKQVLLDGEPFYEVFLDNLENQELSVSTIIGSWQLTKPQNAD